MNLKLMQVVYEGSRRCSRGPVGCSGHEVSQREVVRGCEFVGVSGRNDFAPTAGMCLWLSPGIFFVYARPKTRRLVGLVFT